MPLNLGGVETLRPQVITWNPDAYDEAADARQQIADLKKQGFTVRNEEDGEVILQPPQRDPNQGCFRILSQNGDDRIVWDRRNKKEVKEAFKVFKEFIEKGYTAYVVRSDGSRGHKITDFDYALEEIIFGQREGSNDVSGRGVAGEAGGSRRGSKRAAAPASSSSDEERGPAGEAVLVPKTVPG